MSDSEKLTLVVDVPVDNMADRCIVEAPARIFCWDLEKLLAKKIDGFRRLKSFSEVKPVKLV